MNRGWITIAAVPAVLLLVIFGFASIVLVSFAGDGPADAITDMTPGGVAVTVRITANRAPSLQVLIPLGAETVAEGGHLEYGIIAEDPDGTVPVLSAAEMPQNASLVDSGNGSGSFQFDPDFEQAGNYQVTIIASDGYLADSVQISFTVTGANRAPIVNAAAVEHETREGGHVDVRVWASDPDGTIPALSAAPMPPHAAFVDSGDGSGSVTFDPDYDQAGIHVLTIYASDGELTDSVAITINVAETILPKTFTLQQNYPNPFNAGTTIAFVLGTREGQAAAHVRLDIFNILGQTVITLVDGDLEPGPHTVRWDARDRASNRAPSGVYFYRVTARGRSETRKLVLLR